MNVFASLRVSGICFLLATSPAWAGQRKHKPWLMRQSKTALAAPSTAKGTVLGNSVSKTPSPSNNRVAEDRPLRRGAEKEEGKRIVRQALRYQGTRYKMGGTGKRGMDCSGLVARVWSDLKLKKVPRVSSALYQSGEPVKLAELRPGDLVFFKNTYKHGISHVGVYTGNNKFVHAANHRKGVTITRLSDPYYQVHYAGARRLY